MTPLQNECSRIWPHAPPGGNLVGGLPPAPTCKKILLSRNYIFCFELFVGNLTMLVGKSFWQSYRIHHSKYVQEGFIQGCREKTN